MATTQEIRAYAASHPSRYDLMRQELVAPGTIATYEKEQDRIKKEEEKKQKEQEKAQEDARKEAEKAQKEAEKAQKEAEKEQEIAKRPPFKERLKKLFS